jgi:hypothetical protein
VSRYNILDGNNQVINTIEADDSFMTANYNNYQKVVVTYTEEELAQQAEAKARQWRDSELQATDWIVPVTDHPQHAQYLRYRQGLRDFPESEDFPNTRPTLEDYADE